MMNISVIVPIYNSEDTIAQCIESVLGQTLCDLELLLVDDGSRDGSGTVCDRYAVRDSRVRVVHQENRGRSEARVRGVTMAQGEWICFVDSDDTLPADALDTLFAATTADTDIVFGNGFTLPLKPCPPEIAIEEFRHLAVRAEGTIGVPWGSLYRRSLLTPEMFDVPRHIYNGEDYIFWLRLVFATRKKVRVVSESVYNKGEEHTSGTFCWTAAYCQELNALRMASIPEGERDKYLADTVNDRMANMFSVAVWSPRKEWEGSPYYRELLEDMRSLGIVMPFRHRLFFALPCRALRRLYSLISESRAR